MGTKIGALFSKTNSADMLLYIVDNPGCMKSDIYNNVTRSMHTLEKILEMQDMGLIVLNEGERASSIVPTDKGRKMASLLRKAEALLEESD